MSKMLESLKRIEIKKYIKFLVYFSAIVVLAIVIDQVTKVIAMNFLEYATPVTFIPNFIEFTLVYNTGAAFGMGDDTLWIRVIFNNEIYSKDIYKLIDESYNLAI